MGEVVVSSEGGMELVVQETEVAAERAQQAEKKNQIKNIAADGGGAVADGGSSSVVRWERFLPKLAVRVLLVEADDSTRQIIAALLRKCSYKVAAVPDGLKAWEVLKERSQSIDLILTEIELPSISGYALLTLIMEHDVCKNIPVIMMSSHDSVSTVYKCMLRGAADFLVKPIRKNELRNLWQHVWRKQASRTAAGLGQPEESEAQQKVEATAENNDISNHSSGYMACIQRNRECIEKGSDAQSSCTKPELETEGADVEHVHSLLLPKAAKCLSNEMNIYTQEECHQESRKTQAHDIKAGESEAMASRDANIATTLPGQGKNSDAGWEKLNVIGQNPENNHVPQNSSREAIDLIGAFDNCLKGTFGSPASNASTNKFDILPLLDLSLRRSHPSGSVNQVNDETRRLNHSDASAFSRYINKPLQARNSTSPSTCNQQKDHETNSEKQLSNLTPDYNSDTHGPTISSVRPGLPETSFPHPQQREIFQPIPVRGLRFENIINGFGSLMPQLYYDQSAPSSLPSPGTPNHSPSFTQLNAFYPSDHRPSSSQQFHRIDQRISNAIDQADKKQDQKLETLEARLHVSPANDQSGNGTFYNGHISHHHTTSSGSNVKIDSTLVVKTVPECGNEEGSHVHEGASHRSMQREAALNKFRLKRKDRCFEKKVRYESRKKLAEQRPRVKGQFVRQVPNEPPPGSSSAC
ncbi:two-component response regulator-like APRR5 [Sesamum indicum]|uniref:Two-component response regulator-like APRR5 n=1 Tax=Sesamum indicum TaxID=4182 RepID=A0A6I9TGP5_SESIN|nr:two-component response regulator-like APRR5 [Sesamum indicum]